MLFKRLICLFFLLTSANCFAQEFNFKNIRNQPAAECFFVLQDSKGYLWFSTGNGLCKYNGNSIKRFALSEGMPDNTVFDLFEDSQGRIFFNTSISQIGYIKNDSVFTCGFNTHLNDFLNNGRAQVFSIYEDEKHFFWISTSSGLYRTITPYDLNKIEEVKPESEICPTGLWIIDDKKAMLARYELIVKEHPFFVTQNGKTRVINYSLIPGEPFPSFNKSLYLKNGNLLFSINNRVIIVDRFGNVEEKNFGDRVICLYEDKTGGLWIGFRNIGMVYYKDSGCLDGKGIWSLQETSVSAVFMDHEEGIWVSTLEKGIFYCASKNIIDYSKIEGLDKKISALAVVNYTVLVNDFSIDLSVIRNGAVSKIATPTIWGGVNSFFFFNHKIYMATGLYLYETDTTFSYWKQIVFAGTDASIMLYRLSATPSGEIYAINHGYLFKIEEDRLYRTDTLPSRGRDLYIGNNGEMYVACTNGLYTYQNSNVKYLGQEEKLLAGKINCIKGDDFGNIWVLNNTGTVIIDSTGSVNELIEMTKEFGALNCRDIVFSEDIIWIATDKGLFKINRKNLTVTDQFDTRHGLISNDVHKLAIADNQLWIGTGIGLCVADITSLKTNSIPPQVYVKSVLVNDSLNYKNDFKWNENNFLFLVEGLTYKDENIKFLYRLIGIDTTWRETNVAQVSFNNLDPGSYQFEVKALNADGVASEKPALFSFSIQKPFWLRWWFIMIEVLGLGLLMWWFITYRTKQIQKREEEKTRINKLIAEHQVTALRSQMNPHFIFNAINSIQRYVIENSPKTAYEYLGKFSMLMRTVLNHSKEEKITLDQELEMLQLYVELEQLRFDHFEFNLTINEDVDTHHLFVPTMLLQPYVENAIWHGLMNLKGFRKPVLNITVKQENSHLIISIEDNGVGRAHTLSLKKTDGHKSMGMELTKQRMDLINKLIHGEKVQVKITDLYNGKEAAGTRVEILLSTNLF